MQKLRRYLHDLSLPLVAITCLVVSARAQSDVARPDASPVNLDSKQAAKLALAHAMPEYPPVAKVNFIQGQVQVQLTVDGEGKVVSAHAVDGDALLAVAALQATRQWRYQPLSTASGPARFITKVKVRFTLHCRAMELTPQQAEKDFVRQIKPPQMVRPPEDAHVDGVVHMRLLVNEQGQVVDQSASAIDARQIEAACETLRAWTFRPAYWGTLPVASYFEVDVPVSAPAVTQTAFVSPSH